MLYISETTLRHLMTQVVAAAHSCREPEVSGPKNKTIDPAALRMSALIALQIATGDIVIPQ
jgi:hypothetical protein